MALRGAAAVSYVGTDKGPGGVKVGRRVGVYCGMKAAARVGSMVGVVTGVGVGGGSIIDKTAPGGPITTNGAYTQPTSPGTPGYTI